MIVIITLLCFGILLYAQGQLMKEIIILRADTNYMKEIMMKEFTEALAEYLMTNIDKYKETKKGENHE